MWLIQEKHAGFKAYKALKKGGRVTEAKEAETTYKNAKCVSKHAIWLAKSKAEKEEFAPVSPDGDGVFRIVKQMDSTNQDVVGEKCVRNGADEVALTDGMGRALCWLLKIEFEWPWIFIRARVKPLTIVTTVVSNSRIKSWSC